MDIINDEIMDDIIIEASTVLHNLITKPFKKPPSSRVNPYLKERKHKGRFGSDFSDMIAETKIFHENFHMSVGDFENLFQLVEPYLLPKKHTRPDDEITTKEKLAIVIEYFASGSLQRYVASIYRISKEHLGKIIDDVCDSICLALKCTLPVLNETSYVATSNEFNSRWNFPNCIGAIDGKHVAIKAPNNSGSLFYNYKRHYSIVLMGVADACYKFIYLDGPVRCSLKHPNEKEPSRAGPYDTIS